MARHDATGLRKNLRNKSLAVARHIALPCPAMNTTEIQTHLCGINVTDFAQRHKLPLRTLVRIKSGVGQPTRATAKLVAEAIKKDRKKEQAAAKAA